MDAFENYISTRNLILKQQYILRQRLAELDRETLSACGYSFGDLVKFRKDEASDITENWRMYIIGITERDDVVFAVCSFKLPEIKKLSTKGMFIEINRIEKVK